MHIKPLSALLIIAAQLLITGCSTPQKVAQSEIVTKIPAEPYFNTKTIAHSIQNRPIICHVFGKGNKETILILATIHGNESAGTPLLKELATRLQDQPGLTAGRRVVLVPIVNPDGHAAKRRTNAAGVDLNRNFPADNFRARRNRGSEALSEPESKAIAQLFETYQPDRVVSIHQPIGCIDYDGPAKELAQAIAKAARLPVRKLGLRRGSLGSFVSESNNTPIITLELPGSASRLSQTKVWHKYGNALLTAISFADETVAATE